MNKDKKGWECNTCGFVFDTKVENPEFGIDPPLMILKTYQRIGYVLYVELLSQNLKSAKSK